MTESGIILPSEPTVNVVLRYQGTEYAYTHDDLNSYRFESDEAAADFFQSSYDGGNYGCDCNRALFIDRYCDDAPDFPMQPDGWPGMACGETIELVSLVFVGRFGERTPLLPYPHATGV